MGYRDLIDYDLQRQFLQQEEEKKQAVDRSDAGLGENLWEGLGQLVWGTADSASGGTLGLMDIGTDALDKDDKTEDNRLENRFSFGQANEWEELTTGGKIGYSIGTALGMLAPFGAAGRLASGSVRLGAKAFSGGTKVLAKQASRELAEYGSQRLASKATSKAGQIVQNQSDEIIKVSTKLYDEGLDLANLAAKGGNESVSNQIHAKIAGELASTFKLDSKIAGEVSEEVYKILSHNNPKDAHAIMRATFTNWFGDSMASKVAAAAVYEGVVGAHLGALRQGAAEIYRHYSGYKGADQYGGEYTENAVMSNILHHAWDEAKILSVFGPIKFIKGGSQLGLTKKAGELFRGAYRSMKSVPKMTTQEMRVAIEVMDGVAGKTLMSSHPILGQYAKVHHRWWRTAPREEMRDFLIDARRIFLKEAPGAFAKEWGSEMWKSLPRMIAGTAAMNMSNIAESLSYGHFGWDTFGRDKTEITMNLLTAAYFTRTPHSFYTHKEGKNWLSNRFERGYVDQYINHKHSELKGITGGLQGYGGDPHRGWDILKRYGDLGPETNPNDIFGSAMDTSHEVQQVRDILNPHIVSEKNPSKAPDGENFFSTLDQAKDQYILKNPDKFLNPDGSTKSGELDVLNEKLYIAEQILALGNAHSKDKMNLNSLTADQAIEVIESLSSIEFAGQKLSVHNYADQILEWQLSNISKDTSIPVQTMKSLVVDMYKSMGHEGDVIVKDGVLHLKDITQLQELNLENNWDAMLSLSTILHYGSEQGWIKKGDAATPREYTEAQKTDAVKSWDSHVDLLMDFVHGEGWSNKGVAKDTRIFLNDSWFLASSNLNNIKQSRDAYSLITGDPRDGEQASLFGQTKEKIDKLVGGKKSPKIKTEVESDRLTLEERKERSEIEKFIEILHEANVLSNPLTKRNVSENEITLEQAKELYNEVSNITGDVFTNPEVFSYFKHYTQKMSLNKLELQNSNLNFHIQTGLQKLLTDDVFNQSFGTGRYQLPDFKTVDSELSALKESGKITPEAYNANIKFYHDVTLAVADAKFGQIEFIKPTNEKTISGEDWFKTLQIARIGSENIYTQGHRISSVLDQTLVVEHGLKNQLELIRLGGASSQYAPMTEASKKLEEYLNFSLTTIRDLMGTLKQAKDSGDALVMHAYTPKMNELHSIMTNISSSKADLPRLMEYTKHLQDLKMDVYKKLEANHYTEQAIEDRVQTLLSEQTKKQFGKDAIDSPLRITSAQFGLKYGISTEEMASTLQFTKDNQAEIEVLKTHVNDLLSQFYGSYDTTVKISQNIHDQINSMKASLDSFSKDIKHTQLNPDRYNEYVFKALKLRILADQESGAVTNKRSIEEIEMDVYTATMAQLSSTPVKHLTVDMSSNTLIQSRKPLGLSYDKGVTGLINHLGGLGVDNSNIYVLNSSSIDVDGKKHSILVDTEYQTMKNDIRNGGRDGKGYKIVDPQVQVNFTEKQINEMHQIDYRDTGQKPEYTILDLNESTSIMVRVDSGIQGGIREKLITAFNKPTEQTPAGHLYERLRAIYGNVNNVDAIQSNKEINQFLNTILAPKNGIMTVESIENAILLTNVLLEMPSFIPELVNIHGRVSDKEFKNRWKRLKMGASKGFVGTQDNLDKVAGFYRNAESKFHQDIYEEVKEWIEPNIVTGKRRKIKSLSIADELDYNSGVNIFSSIERFKMQLNEDFKTKKITQDQLDRELKNFATLSKSIVDGHTFITKDLMLASMSMQGISKDMVYYDAKNGVTGFKSGAIKPVIVHTDIETDIASPKFGRLQEWYGKTSFQYNEKIELILNKLGIDMLTFESANKINIMKTQNGEWFKDSENKGMQHTLPGLAVGDPALNGSWVDYVFNNVNPKNVNNRSVVHLPFSAISLRNISKEHDPMISNNTAVHMKHNNGMAEWIGTKQKLDNYREVVSAKFNNLIYSTELARELAGAGAKDGDVTFSGSGLDYVLQQNGLMTDPWMHRKIESQMISHFINNGKVGAGIVHDGSIDIMQADMGNLRAPIKSVFSLGLHAGQEMRSVQYFGEYQMSYYAGQKPFQVFGVKNGRNTKGGMSSEGLGTPLIQEITYQLPHQKLEGINPASGNSRTADAFFIQTRGVKSGDLLIVEGMGITKEGNTYDLWTDKILDLPTIAGLSAGAAEKIRVANAKVYRDAKNNQDLFLDHATNGGTITMDQAVVMADNYNQVRKQNFGSTYTQDIHIGTLNSRQPRMMMGDIVVAKVKGEYDSNGNIISGSLNKNEGNVSRMNHVDAISPQDSDFDMDKSFSYNAAPGSFLKETGRLAGYDLTKGNEESIGRMFEEIFEKQIPLQGSDAHSDAVRYGGTFSRGKFVKMHQTITYLANIFAKDNMIGKFEEGHITRTVRFNDRAGYINTVDKIAEMAKRYIDIYANAPRLEHAQRAQRAQDAILFGKDGIFEIYHRDRDGKETRITTQELNSNEFQEIKHAINTRLVSPLNKYLTLNKGASSDSFNTTHKSSLSEFNKAFTDLGYALDGRKEWMGVYPDSYDGLKFNMSPGLQSAQKYHLVSENPYDVAMRNLHEIHAQQTQQRLNQFKTRSMDRLSAFEHYIIHGFDVENSLYKGFDKSQPWVNNIINKSLKEYVADEAGILHLADLDKQLSQIDRDIYEVISKTKGNVSLEGVPDYTSLKARKDRLVEVKTKLEAALTTTFGAMPEPGELIKHQGFSGNYKFINYNKQPVVVLRKGKIVEVVGAGERAQKDIYKTDKLVLNGRRFEVVDPIQHGGLKASYLALSGVPTYIAQDGSRVKMNQTRYDREILGSYSEVLSTAMGAADKIAFFNQGGFKERAALIQDAIIYEIENNFLIQNGQQGAPDIGKFAFMFSLLTPKIDRKVTAITAVVDQYGRRTVAGDKYKESQFAEATYSFLAKVAQGKIKGIQGFDAEIAKEILNTVTRLKKVAVAESQWGVKDIHLVESRFVTEPADVMKNGFLTTDRHVDRSVYEKLEDSNKNTVKAAEILVKWAEGDPMVDGVTLYRASKVLESAGIPLNQQFIKTIKGDRKLGKSNTVISTIDLESSKHRQWGNKSSIHKESASELYKRKWECVNR